MGARAFILGGLCLGACGGVFLADVEAWDRVSAPARARIVEYQTLVTATVPVATCVSDRDRYVSDLGPALDAMETTSSQADGCFSMGYGSVAGMCSDMSGELARYATQGCSNSDPAQNSADALAHCERMLALMEQSDNVVGSCR